jgi:RimJ/RimL family protein N-acetyltransferase
MLETAPTLTSARLTLRPWREEDLEPFAELNADAQVMEYLLRQLTRPESDALADRMREQFRETGFGWWAVEAPGVAGFIGAVGLSVPAYSAAFTPCVEIGWRLARAHWGRGYAHEAARAVLAFGFEQAGLNEIVAITVPDNHRSRALMARLGMVRALGEDFDHPLVPAGHRLVRHVLYRLSKEEWRALLPPWTPRQRKRTRRQRMIRTIDSSDQVNRRLVILEGIMGSGKSTTMRSIAARMEAAQRRVNPIHERVDPHPIRATDELEHWFQPWLDETPEGLVERSLKKWRSFVDTARASDAVQLVDGQLFHGDLTNLFLMEAEFATIAAYVQAVAVAIRPLNPLLIYFHQDDVDQAIRVVSAERGDAWVKYQVDWKLQAPYSRRRGLAGIDGLVALYEDYRALTDRLYAGLDLAKLAIENSRRDWPLYHRLIFRELAIGDEPASIKSDE